MFKMFLEDLAQNRKCIHNYRRNKIKIELQVYIQGKYVKTISHKVTALPNK